MKQGSRRTAELNALMVHLPVPGRLCRWTHRRKMAVVAAVENGHLALEAACRAYRLSREEFALWRGELEIRGKRLPQPMHLMG